ncbi:MAG: MazG nucleotide pyrophosphohydrolase domain-containing protein [Legionellaceae bacterium]|nr:MazG nucleotide pyrophosphohydrolase domain-containing protein [Legionellaceae bacterium]
MDIIDKIEYLEHESNKFGFAWEKSSQIMEQIKSECLEVEEHLHPDNIEKNRDDLQEEIGDLLHAVFSLCVFVDCDIKETITKTADKFESRLNMVKLIAHEQGLEGLSGHSFDKLMQIWDEAKLRIINSK